MTLSPAGAVACTKGVLPGKGPKTPFKLMGVAIAVAAGTLDFRGDVRAESLDTWGENGVHLMRWRQFEV